MASMLLNRIILITACVFYFGNIPVKAQIYESESGIIYLTLTCTPDPDGAGLQSIPADITSIDDDVACAVSESDEFVVINAGARVIEYDRKKRAVNNPSPDNVRLGNTSATERRSKRAIPEYDVSYLIETTAALPRVQPEFTAIPGHDYEHVSFVWSLFPYPANYVLKVPIIQDDTAEEDELFQVNLYDLVSSYLEEEEGNRRKRDTSNMYPCVKVLIVDDDVNFKFSSPVYLLDQDTRSATVSIEKTQGTLATQQTLALTAEDMSNSDNAIEVIPQEIYFTDAESEIIHHTFTLMTNGDSELPNVVKITMTNGDAEKYPSEAVVLNVQSGSSQPSALDMDTYVVSEGDSFEVTIYRTGDISEGTLIELTTDSINAIDPDDYDDIRIPVSFPNGEDYSDPITIFINEDKQVESLESFELVVLSDGNKVSASTVFIVDNDVDYCFESQTYVAEEEVGSVSVTLVKKGNLHADSIRIEASDGDAVFPSDYGIIRQGGSSEALPSPLSWPVGEDKLVIDIGIVDDNVPEWPQVEFFNVHVLNGDDILCSTKVLIKDDDAKCNPTCSNGGLCVGPNRCLCIGPYTGPTCLTEGCTCQNNGICLPYTEHCWCPAGYTGTNCEYSLCKPACQNGGQCSAEAVCLCPPGYTGVQCQTVSRETGKVIAGRFSIAAVNGAPAVFIPEYNVDGSPERLELLAEFMPILRSALNYPDVEGISILGFEPGSIVVQYNVILKPESQMQAEDVADSISKSFIPSAAASGIIVDASSDATFTQELCPDGYCANGGTCIADTLNIASTCSCTSDFYGSQCQNRRSGGGLDAGQLAGLIIGVLGGILITILLALLRYIYVKRSQTKSPEAPTVSALPTVETLDLASYAYTNPRSYDIGQDVMLF